MKKLIMWMMLSAVLIICSTEKETYAAAKVMNWHLTDGTHLDWDGKTVYQSNFNYAVKVWNGYRKGFIRKDNLFRLQDVAISDYSEISNTAGVTCSDGTIRFNKFVMSQLNTKQRTNVCIHELGHALGLDHNTSRDIMYMYLTERIKLSTNDKKSYDYAFEYLY